MTKAMVRSTASRASNSQGDPSSSDSADLMIILTQLAAAVESAHQGRVLGMHQRDHGVGLLAQLAAMVAVVGGAAPT